MCFSSTMATGIKYFWPKSLSGANADDDYLRTVLKYGDTTNALAQVRAAAARALSTASRAPVARIGGFLPHPQPSISLPSFPGSLLLHAVPAGSVGKHATHASARRV